MPVDLSWLSDKSIPLFFAFMALQAIHETAHIAVAKAKNVSLEACDAYSFLSTSLIYAKTVTSADFPAQSLK